MGFVVHVLHAGAEMEEISPEIPEWHFVLSIAICIGEAVWVFDMRFRWTIITRGIARRLLKLHRSTF